MRKAISLVLSLLSLFAVTHTVRATEMTWEFSVQVSAAVQATPAQITLSWPQDQYMLPNSYTVYRKAPSDSSWGAGVLLPATATSYTDNHVTVGTPYEYQVVKVTSQYTGYGYVYSGINVPMTDSRGKLLLVIDNTYAASLTNELARLQQDLVGDGWTVIPIFVNRSDSVVSVKNLIKAQYAADPANVNCVFLFGHVPVPYSGNIVPDGHTPDHQGAWPCDGYYGDMDGIWTDNSVNVTGQYDPRNTNVPGDGKFDQSSFPAPIKLMVGRVDLANMPGELWYGGPTTMPSELELLRNYLNKDHNFRTKQMDLPRRGIVGDFFGVRSGEAFAASGWRNFAPFFGANNVTTDQTMGAWTPILSTNAYLWAYGCGAGSFTSIAGLGNSDSYNDVTTPELYTNDIKAAFTLLFGSWLGDWDAKDNIMRCVLALPSCGLTCAWSGRPHWFLHHMALGMPIGFSARLTQNNGPGGIYSNEVNSAAGEIHIALMGDPTLRMHAVVPPSNIAATTNGSAVTLNWTASTDSVVGYHIYRASGTNNSFARLTTTPITGTTFTDSSASGASDYMVRAVKLETSSSGTYFNPSEGAFLAPVGSATGYLGVTGTSGSTSGTNGTVSSTGGTGSTNSVTPTGTSPNLVAWVDDALPAGATAGTDGGDAWNWVSSNPAPFSGSLANQSTISAGLHQHFFTGATQPLTVNTGDILFAYVYLDPNNLPSQIMLQWNDGSSWEHRAYWGADNINYGSDGTTSRVYMGPLPAAGQWVLLQVPASKVALEGSTVPGMAFSQYDGRATWDYAGKSSALLTGTTPSNGGTNTVGSSGSTNSTGTVSSTSTTNTLVSPLAWVDDTLPAGAVAGADGGDSWNWISSNPGPFSGALANQSSVAPGLHEHFFSWASQGLSINSGDTLFAYVYIDPNNPPSELMLQWHDGASWDHRAYWGANNITYGTDGTASRSYMGPLPAAGQWALLQVPASQVGMGGATAVGIAFSQFDGRATWDYTGKAAGVVSTTTASGGGTNTSGTGGTTGTSSTNSTGASPNLTVWIDDALPAGAVPGSDGGDAWNWVSSNPTPYSGSLANQSAVAYGLHQHFFMSATQTLSINSGDILFAYVYIDPSNIPSEIMLQWNDGTWEHRAYWGANKINYGTDGTTSCTNMGPVPAAGQWVLLQVPASKVALEGSAINGMSFSQYDGRATWDYSGKSSALLTGTAPASGGSTSSTNTATLTNATVWVDDALPAGASPSSDGGDSWNWVSSNPAPFSGSLANQSSIGSGLHEHFFTGATQTMAVNTGDNLFAYVYLDPNNLPSEIMLQWNDGSWEHRAFWGQDNIGYGTAGTTSRVYVGPLPAPGQWALLQVPASAVALEGSTVSGMAFSQFDGRATWDYAGKASAPLVSTSGGGTVGSGTNSTGGTGITGTDTNSTPVTTTNNPPVVSTNSPSSTNTIVASTNAVSGVSLIDYVTPQLPHVGDNTLHVLTPTLLELKLINTKQPDPAQVAQWNLVDSLGNFQAPGAGAFAVTANGQTVAVTAVGFKRRPLYAPMAGYDLRIDNSLYLQLASPISDNQTIEVKNTDGSLWPSSMQFIATVDPLRYSPAIHVNEEGYMPNYSKVAMVGYYAGSMGEVSIPASAGFKIVDAATGNSVYQGTLAQRPDSGYTYSPTPYQKVYQADFSSFNTPGEYRLVVPGMGGSLPFMIHDGVAMAFARAYALGLYHQRCGTNTAMPFTRFTHDACHTAPASVPASASAYPFTWTTIAGYANTLNANNPTQIAPALTSPSAQLFPYINQGPVDVTGGHHDAGDYSKYTINSASLIHYLMFAVDSLPGVAALDNLGIPESGDGISDVMQEAKWEADFLAKMQDSDGGFYFLVYPQNREYEGNVTPDHGDPQVVWPKTTSVTAASVAALAQCASSPLFKQTYPAAAAAYLQKAKLGWQFLMNAVNKYGKNGAYQKITHYGDNFADNDEMAWAACQMYLATGDSSIHQLLLSWFDPADPATWRWGWWHMSECYGHAIRSYAFAVQSGRATASQLDATFLSKCQAQIAAGANDMVSFSQQNAYGSSFPIDTKAVQSAGWYFSCDQAFDIAVAYQLNPNPAYINAMLANMNFEGGCNPVNVSYVTGLGWKRQRDIVSQWALNDTRVLPPSGIPVGNISATFGYLWDYSGELEGLCFPSDGATTAPYPFYDRWGDSWNVSSEMVVLNQARGIGMLAFLAAQGPYKTQLWTAPANAQIVVPASVVPVGSPVTLSLQAPGMDLSGARVTWEARDQEPIFGQTFTYSPQNNGLQWVEAEAQWPDGRRVFAKASYTANSPNIVWIDDTVPAGAAALADGGDAWTWLSSNPTPHSGTLANQSNIGAGEHQHYFQNATATMSIGTGDVLYAWVYIDPNNMPSELMLQWNDGTSWDHRAYWGADSLGYGADGTPGRVNMGPLPPAGQWVQLKVPANQVNLEGATLSGMSFTLYGGRATWDAAGRLSSGGTSNTTATVTVNATATLASRTTPSLGTFTFSRGGDLTANLPLQYALGGTAVSGLDYQVSAPGVTIPAGASSTTLNIVPLISSNFIAGRSVILTLASNASYAIGAPGSATLAVGGNTMPLALSLSPSGATLSWNSASAKSYQVSYKNNLTDPTWTTAGQITATAGTSSWVDPSALKTNQRFYLVAQVD
ncbi:MAG TPA: glycoside hydrolase family 9 protein [Verrucomicrobiae bacterium]|nr:glycoside hydrolase family 9 protein [Verrucomicrobiae bacterium]